MEKSFIDAFTLRKAEGVCVSRAKIGSVIQVILDPQSHGMVDQNHQPIPGRSAANYERERRVSPVCIPAVYEEWPYA